MAGSKVLSRARSSLEGFEAWDWKAAHEAAMECLDLEEWMEQGCKMFDSVEGLRESLRRTIYQGQVDASDDYRECFAFYTMWLAKATQYRPMSLLAKCEKRFEIVRGADLFRDRVSQAKRIIETWVDPSQVPMLSARYWDMTEDEAEEVDAVLEGSVAPTK